MDQDKEINSLKEKRERLRSSLKKLRALKKLGPGGLNPKVAQGISECEELLRKVEEDLSQPTPDEVLEHGSEIKLLKAFEHLSEIKLLKEISEGMAIVLPSLKAFKRLKEADSSGEHSRDTDLISDKFVEDYEKLSDKIGKRLSELGFEQYG